VDQLAARTELNAMSRPHRRGRRDDLHGVLIIDKPHGMTSAAVVDEVRRRAEIASAGHTGTLDPIATGVLPVCVGTATKLAQWLTAEDKAYEATIDLGVETDSYDIEGTVTRRDPDAAARVDRAAIEQALVALAQSTEQVPPMHSAIRQGGVRLHELARAGVEVERAPRPVRFERLELLSFEPPRARIAIACSKGTYVRSLVRDLGERLGCGATLAELRRTASGRFTIDQAFPIDAITSPMSAAARLIPAAQAIGLPALTIPPDRLRDVLDGRALDCAALAPGLFQVLGEDGRVLAICERVGDTMRYHRVLEPPRSR
jgi:tRNA pseudouridine55 synthase